MHYAHTDLLSYEDIDKDVDRIFRAFCDTSLIEFAKNSAGAGSRDYWEKVLAFRQANLTSFDRPDLLAKAGRKPGRSPDQPGQEVSDYANLENTADDQVMHCQGFIYWFDVRSEYWSRHGADQKLLDTLVPATQLGSLYGQAKIVQERIHNAQQIAAVIEWGPWDGSGKNALIITKIMEGTSNYKDESSKQLAPRGQNSPIG